jgi:superfamily I DNA/RNA helicase
VDEFWEHPQYKWLPCSRTQRCGIAVEDDDQSICFRGAASPTCGFEQVFATTRRPVSLIKLERNYRSHPGRSSTPRTLYHAQQARRQELVDRRTAQATTVRAFAAPSDP